MDLLPYGKGLHLLWEETKNRLGDTVRSGGYAVFPLCHQMVWISLTGIPQGWMDTVGNPTLHDRHITSKKYSSAHASYIQLLHGKAAKKN